MWDKEEKKLTYDDLCFQRPKVNPRTLMLRAPERVFPSATRHLFGYSHLPPLQRLSGRPLLRGFNRYIISLLGTLITAKDHNNFLLFLKRCVPRNGWKYSFFRPPKFLKADVLGPQINSLMIVRHDFDEGILTLLVNCVYEALVLHFLLGCGGKVWRGHSD